MNRTLLLPVLAVALVGTAIATLPLKTQKQPKVIEQHRVGNYPIAEYETAQLADHDQGSLRKARNKHHNLRLKSTEKVDVKRFMLTEDSKSSWGGPPTHAPTEPGLPTTQSDIVAIGDVTDARAFLSEDKTNVYSEFTVRIADILKNSTSIALGAGSSITTVRNGGAVRFPTGKIIQRGFGGKPFPLVKRQYVFFLSYENNEDAYRIITAYELRDGTVVPLDGPDIDGSLLEPYAGYLDFKGWSAPAFLKKVRETLVSPIPVQEQ